VAEKNERPIKVVAENRKARFNYAIEDTVEAGIALTGTEVKSIRNGKTTIAESYADTKDGEIWLINANIPEYLQANRFNHEPKRPRKLLLHRKQINKLMGAVDREGQEAARQARDRKETRLGPGKRPPDAGAGIEIFPHPEERALARVSKDEIGASWFETALARLLTMESECDGVIHESEKPARRRLEQDPGADG